MESTENYIFPIEDTLEMILMFDGNGKISYANAAAMKELEYEGDLCGHHIHDVFPNSFSLDQDGFKTDVSFGGELINLVAYRKNQTCFPVEAKMLDNSNSFGQYICLANDILEKEFLCKEIEQVKQEAQQAMKVKSEFVANVTHELRTPVNGILGNVGICLGLNWIVRWSGICV